MKSVLKGIVIRTSSIDGSRIIALINWTNKEGYLKTIIISPSYCKGASQIGDRGEVEYTDFGSRGCWYTWKGETE